ncbi:MAG: hypothetical protein R3C05_02360 [Pirellulaceae bacterium]
MQRIYHNWPIRRRAWLPVLLLLLGCRTTTQIAVWQPPLGTSGLNKRIVVAPLEGSVELTASLAKSIQSRPGNDDFGLRVVSAYELSQADTIQLVGFAEGSSSDVALLPVARRASVDFVLMGEVLNDPFSKHRTTLRHDDPQIAAKLDQLLASRKEDKTLALSWRVIDVASGNTVWAGPVSVSPAFVAEAHPDLAERFAPR